MLLSIRIGVFLVLMLTATIVVADATDVEIRQMLNYLAEEWNAGDLNSVRGRFHRDFVLFTADGRRDREQRINELELFMAEGQDHGVLSYSDIEVKKIGKDHALVYGKSRLKFDDGTEIDSAFSSVYLNTPFGWKVVYTHE